MPINVPRSNALAGAAASIQVATPDTGAAFAELGQAMKQVGDGIQQERAAREMERTKLTMMRGLQDLRLKWEQSGDPDALDTQFPAEAQALKAELTKGLMPRNQADAGLMFDQIVFSHTNAIGVKALDLRQSQKRVTLDEIGRVAVGAATTDPETSATYMQEYRKSLDALVADNTLTPEQADAKWREVTGGSDMAQMERLFADDPQALLTGIEGGQLGQNLDGDTREKWRTRAIARIEADNAAKVQADKVARSETIAQGRDLLKDGMGVFRKGSDFARQADIEKLRSNPDLAAELVDELAEYDNAHALYKAMPAFATLSLDGKKRARAEAAADPKAKAYQADIVTAMDASIAEHEAAVRNGDLYAYAESIGVSKIPALPDPKDPNADLASAFKKRAFTAQALTSTGMTGFDSLGRAIQAPIFTPEEKETYAALVAADAPPKDKARLAAALSVLGPNADRAARELGADPVMDWITGGIGNEALSPKLALEVFEGQRAAEQKQISLPPIDQRRGAFFSQFSGLFNDGTGDGPDENPQMQAAVQAADALYALRSRATPPVAGVAVELDQALWAQAFHEVMGGTGAYGSSDARGGLAEVDTGGETYKLILPKGVAGQDVEAAFETIISRAGDGGKGGSFGGLMPPMATVPVMDDDAWKAMSISGRPPRAGGKPIDAKTFSSARLQPLGGDVYELEVLDQRTGRYVAIGDDQGAPWAFRMADFLKAGMVE